MMMVNTAKMVLDAQIHHMTNLRDNLTDDGGDLHPEQRRMLLHATVDHMRDLTDELAMDVFMRRPLNFDADHYHDLLGIVHELNEHR